VRSSSGEELKVLAERVRSCSACGLSGTRRNALPGEGDPCARVFLIALSPGRVEDREGRMFLGPSGDVLDRLLEHAGVGRSRVYMTNLVKCTLPKNRRPRAREIEACAPWLEREISLVDPKVLVPLGFYSSRHVMSTRTEDAPRGRPDYRPLYGKLLLSGRTLIYPLPHPSSLLYRPSLEPGTAEKYDRLRFLTEPCRWYPACPMKRYFEAGLIESRWVDLYCLGDWSRCVRFHCEERGEQHPDRMMPDGSLREDLKDR